MLLRVFFILAVAFVVGYLLLQVVFYTDFFTRERLGKIAKQFGLAIVAALFSIAVLAYFYLTDKLF